MPSICDFSSSSTTVSLLRCFFLCSVVRSALSVKPEIRLCVCFFTILSSLSSLSMCVILWCQPSISDPFLRFTANFTPSSLCRFNPSIIPLCILPRFEANSATFHRKIQLKPSLCQFYAPPPPHTSFYFILVFYIKVQIIFALTLFFMLFAVLFPLHRCTHHSLLHSLSSSPKQALSADVVLTGLKRRAACARSGWLQVTSVCINTHIQPSILEQGTKTERDRGEKADRWRKSFVSFTLVHEAGRAICHVLSLLHH